MNIIVCLKQVPDTQDIKWTDKGTMIRDGVESIVNPYDEYALEYALKIKDKYPDTKITVLSMGPMQAQELLKIAIAKGADDAILACDKKFSGADTYATSLTLAHVIKKYVPDFDLILCGQFAIDGDTAQTPSSLAGHLDIEQVTFVQKFIDFNSEGLILRKETEDAYIDIRVNYPCVVSVLQSDFPTRKYTIKGYIEAENYDVKVLNNDDIGIDENLIGFKGSPTYVSRSFHPELERNTEELAGDKTDIVNSLVKIIREEGKV